MNVTQPPPPEDFEYKEMDIMPNSDRSISVPGVPVNGRWYWYKNSESIMDKISARDINGVDHVWYDNSLEGADSTAGDSYRPSKVNEICISGQLGVSRDQNDEQYVGIGFKLCNFTEDELENIPSVLGLCENDKNRNFRFCLKNIAALMAEREREK